MTSDIGRECVYSYAFLGHRPKDVGRLSAMGTNNCIWRAFLLSKFTLIAVDDREYLVDYAELGV